MLIHLRVNTLACIHGNSVLGGDYVVTTGTLVTAPLVADAVVIQWCLTLVVEK